MFHFRQKLRFALKHWRKRYRVPRICSPGILLPRLWPEQTPGYLGDGCQAFLQPSDPSTLHVPPICGPCNKYYSSRSEVVETSNSMAIFCYTCNRYYVFRQRSRRSSSQRSTEFFSIRRRRHDDTPVTKLFVLRSQAGAYISWRSSPPRIFRLVQFIFRKKIRYASGG